MSSAVQPFVSRAKVSEEIEGLRIIIPPRRSLAILFILGWLGAWTVGGVTAGASLFHRFSLFILFWMFAWLFGELMVGYIVFNTIGGPRSHSGELRHSDHPD